MVQRVFLVVVLLFVTHDANAFRKVKYKQDLDSGWARRRRRSSGKTVWLSGTEVYDTGSGVPVRPNYLKHERCHGDSVESCFECFTTPDSVNDCINHGNDDELYTMDLHVTDSQWKVYRSVFGVQCSESGASSTLIVEVHADPEYAASWKVIVNKEVQIPSGENKYSVPLVPRSLGQKGTEVHIEFHASQNGNSYSAGKILAKLDNVNSEYVNCEDNLVCLRILTDAPDARELRSSNEYQLRCLNEFSTSLAPDSSLPADLNKICAAWKDCLGASGRAGHLEMLLTAGLKGHHDGSPFAMLQEQHTVEKCTDNSGCIDPRTSDAEGWDCNCEETWEAKCASIGYANSPDCIAASFCLSEYVCKCWKEVTCHASEVTRIMEQLRAASLFERQSSLSAKTSDADIALDRSTGSKSCI